MKIDVVQLEIKKMYTLEIDIENSYIYTAKGAAKVFCSLIGGLNVEHVGMLTLDATNKVINYFTVSIGNQHSVKVSMAQLFKNALVSNAAKIIVGHNHPSGVLEVTSKDVEMTKKIGFFASNFDMELIDSLVVTKDDYISIRSKCKEL